MVLADDVSSSRAPRKRSRDEDDASIPPSLTTSPPPERRPSATADQLQSRGRGVGHAQGVGGRGGGCAKGGGSSGGHAPEAPRRAGGHGRGDHAQEVRGGPSGRGRGGQEVPGGAGGRGRGGHAQEVPGGRGRGGHAKEVPGGAGGRGRGEQSQEVPGGAGGRGRGGHAQEVPDGAAALAARLGIRVLAPRPSPTPGESVMDYVLWSNLDIQEECEALVFLQRLKDFEKTSPPPSKAEMRDGWKEYFLRLQACLDVRKETRRARGFLANLPEVAKLLEALLDW